MRIDFRDDPADAHGALGPYRGGRVTVDGVHVRLAWFIDTDEGFVKTYDALGDGKAHAAVGLGPDVIQKVHCGDLQIIGDQLEHGGVLSKTIRGKVELLPPEPK